jgi:hypothetical protein
MITEDTGTQGAGRWQLEGTSEHEKDRATRRREDVSGFVLSHGFAAQADWQVTLPWHRAGEDGIGDLALDLKWRFFERDAFSLGLKPGVTLPTGDRRAARGAGKAAWGALLIASFEPGPLAFHAHAGYRANRNELGERESLRHVSAAMTYQVGSVKLVADAARDTHPDPAVGGAERYLVLGAIWSVRRDFDLDAGIKTGHGSADLDDALLFGATLRW